MILEMCIDSVEGTVAAAEGGAQRAELCANLLEGGTTPSLGMAREARRRAPDLGLSVMVRPRGGDFCYAEEEFAVMREDVKIFREEGIDCVVFGMLTPEGDVDEARTRDLTDLARPLQVTFHRAFDMTRDAFAALETLIELGVDRILTSGQEPSVLEGIDLIRDLGRKAGNRIVVMPGCGITFRNLDKIVRETGAREIHVAAPEPRESLMRYRNTDVFMGTALRSEEYGAYVTTASGVRAFADKLRNSSSYET